MNTTEKNTQELDIRKVEIHGKECAYDGKKFWAYKAVTKGGKFVDARFTMGCTEKTPVPKKEKFWAFIRADKMNYDDKNYKYPRTWIKQVESFQDYDDGLHEVEIDTSDLPF